MPADACRPALQRPRRGGVDDFAAPGPLSFVGCRTGAQPRSRAS